MGTISIYKTAFWYLTAPELYQREMDRLFEWVPVEIIVDDFLVHGKDQSEVDDEKSVGEEQRGGLEV